MSLASIFGNSEPANNLFELAVETCPNGMLMTDGAGKILIVNNEIERMFGYRRGELVGQSVDILVPEGMRTRHVQHRREFKHRPQARRLGASRDLCGVRKDGSEFPVEIGLSATRAGEEFFVLSAIVDISARKQRERLKDEFVSTVSHELRTPMTSISGALGLIVAGAAGKLPDSAARLITIAQTNCQRLVRLVNDILDMEKLASGRVEFTLKRVEPLPLVEQAIDAIRGFADGYGVRVLLEASSVPGTINVDPDRFAQVMTNLLSNAIKFSPRNGEVMVVIEKRRDNVCISVRDHGPGIPAEFKRHVFEQFAQADATDGRQNGGTGLGLSIVRQIVTRLGGRVAFDDAPGGGTVFYVELPSPEHAADAEKNLMIPA
jgi:PAS domain S-box-containing protein